MAEPIETCVSCGSEHSIYDEHEANNCVEVLHARLAKAEADLAAANDRAETWFTVAHDRQHAIATLTRERDDWAFRCGGAEAERDEAKARTNQMHRRAQEAESIAIEAIVAARLACEHAAKAVRPAAQRAARVPTMRDHILAPAPRCHSAVSPESAEAIRDIVQAATGRLKEGDDSSGMMCSVCGQPREHLLHEPPPPFGIACGVGALAHVRAHCFKPKAHDEASDGLR